MKYGKNTKLSETDISAFFQAAMFTGPRAGPCCATGRNWWPTLGTVWAQ